MAVHSSMRSWGRKVSIREVGPVTNSLTYMYRPTVHTSYKYKRYIEEYCEDLKIHIFLWPPFFTVHILQCWVCGSHSCFPLFIISPGWLDEAVCSIAAAVITEKFWICRFATAGYMYINTFSSYLVMRYLVPLMVTTQILETSFMFAINEITHFCEWILVLKKL